MYPQRLPRVDDDDGIWGDILLKYLTKEHYNIDNDDATNGGHKNVTIRPGTAGAGGAPLTFTSGTLLTTPEVGAMEFAGDNLYLTQTSGATRKKVADGKVDCVTTVVGLRRLCWRRRRHRSDDAVRNMKLCILKIMTVTV
mgnify:CR=1 FL=1